MTPFTSIEICAGAGGQAIGLERAGFEHLALVEIDKNACATLRYNRPEWDVHEMDVKEFSAVPYKGVDLFAGGVPCPPFSIAGKQLGKEDERDLFPEALRLISECCPKAVMLENVKGILSKRFSDYRLELDKRLNDMGYFGAWRLITSADYGVPQLRPRAIYVGLKKEYLPYFAWPEIQKERLTVGEALYDLMASNGWKQAENWRSIANDIAPTLVGGSKKHGGADLGPTRAKQSWAKLGVDGKGINENPPDENFEGMPRLTVQMAGIVQGFPEDWHFTGRKTPAYRQVGNAFPPPTAAAIGKRILYALQKKKEQWPKEKELELNFGNIL